jgi:hypothetical protein
MKYLNHGQLVLLGYTKIALHEKFCKGFQYTPQQEECLSNFVRDYSDEEWNDNDIEKCPDWLIMTQPENSWEIFLNWFEEWQDHIEEMLEEIWQEENSVVSSSSNS